ncbi:MAG: LicD family protein [Micrococcaceae bacterium]
MNKIQSEEYRILVKFDQICRKHSLKYALGYGTLLGAVRHKGFIPWDDDIDILMTRAEFNKFEEIIQDELAGSDLTYQSHELEPYYMSSTRKIRSNRIELAEPNLAHTPITQGVFMDIFLLDQMAKDTKQRKKQLRTITFANTLMLLFYTASVEPTMNKLETTVFKTLEKLKKKTYKFNKIFTKIYDLKEKAITSYNNVENDTGTYTVLSGYYFKPHKIEKLTWPKECFEDLIELKFEDKKFMAPKQYDEILTAFYGDYMTLPPEKERKSHLS